MRRWYFHQQASRPGIVWVPGCGWKTMQRSWGIFQHFLSSRSAVRWHLWILYSLIKFNLITGFWSRPRLHHTLRVHTGHCPPCSLVTGHRPTTGVFAGTLYAGWLAVWMTIIYSKHKLKKVSNPSDLSGFHIERRVPSAATDGWQRMVSCLGL